MAKTWCNIFEFERKKYLLIIDYFSKYFFISDIRSTAAETAINKFKDILRISRDSDHWQWSPIQQC